MTDSNWQLAVLRDLGATQRGFADTAPAEPRPAPVQVPDPAEIAGTAQVPAQIPPQDPATGTGGFPGLPGLPASGEPATSAASAPAMGFEPSGGDGFATGSRPVPTPHADAPVAGPAAQAVPDLGTSTGPAPALGPVATPHADAPVAGPAAADLGTSTGPGPTPGPDAPWGAPSSAGDQPSTGGDGATNSQPSASGGTGQWSAPPASGGGENKNASGDSAPDANAWNAPADGGATPDNTWGASNTGAKPDNTWGAPESGAKPGNTRGAPDTGAKPDNAWGVPDTGAKPDNAWGVPDTGAKPDNAWGAPEAGANPDNSWGAPASGGQPDNAWGAPVGGDGGQVAAASSGGEQNVQGDASWGAQPANTGGGTPPAQDGFPGIAAQQNPEPAQPLGAPPAPPGPDASWGPAAGGEGPSGFPGIQGPGQPPGPGPNPGPENFSAPGFEGMPGGPGMEGMPGPALDHTMGGRQGAQDGMSGQQGQGEPLLHADFAWEAAINPVLGGGGGEQQDEAQDQEQGQDAWQQQAEQSAPNPQQQAAAAGPHPASELVRKNVHGDRMGKRLGRGVRKAVGGGSAMSAQQQAAFADLMARPVPSFRQIAIASVRGGAGKTTISALLASELARHRQDRVVAIDADAELGSLPLRLGIVPQLSLFELAQANPATFDEAARFMSQTPEGLWVLSSTRGGRMSREFDVPTFQRALSSVSRFVSAAVVDCGAGILTGVNQEIIAQTHALVLVTPGTVDGALSARGALEWFANNGRQHVFQRAVVAMVSHAPQINADLGRAEEMLTQWGLPVVHVPYDRQVATGAALDLDKVGGATRQAAAKIVYQAFARSLGMPGVQ
ncbi:AAA family ATPase [Spirillospora sp. NPDC052269]